MVFHVLISFRFVDFLGWKERGSGESIGFEFLICLGAILLSVLVVEFQTGIAQRERQIVRTAIGGDLVKS